MAMQKKLHAYLIGYVGFTEQGKQVFGSIEVTESNRVGLGFQHDFAAGMLKQGFESITPISIADLGTYTQKEWDDYMRHLKERAELEKTKGALNGNS